MYRSRRFVQNDKTGHEPDAVQICKCHASVGMTDSSHQRVGSDSPHQLFCWLKQKRTVFLSWTDLVWCVCVCVRMCGGGR